MMFPYDGKIAAACQSAATTIPEVIGVMQTIDQACTDGDGLKWFNWLYLQVTQTVERKIDGSGLEDAAWLAELDVQFAALYFSALRGYLAGGECPQCWAAMFAVRANVRLARIQCALAGINAHINHDLPAAIVATCTVKGTTPGKATPQYRDYTALNAPIDSLIEVAKRTLMVRLLGDSLPVVSHVEDMAAAWGTSEAREQAWNHAEALWELRGLPAIAQGYLDGLDGLVTFGNKALLTAALEQ